MKLSDRACIQLRALSQSQHLKKKKKKFKTKKLKPTGLKARDSPASVSQVLELDVCHHAQLVTF